MKPDMDALDGLIGRLKRALEGRSVEQVFLAPRALVGLGVAIEASGDRERARRAVAKLEAGAPLSPDEHALLEAAIRQARPLPWLQGPGLPDGLLPGLDPVARRAIAAAVPGIARLDRDHDLPVGTGFQLGPRVLATCAHVVELLLEGAALGRGRAVARFDRGGEALAEAITITRVLELQRREDLALVELASEGPVPRGLELAPAPLLPRGMPVLAVGFPLHDSDAPRFVEALLEGLHGVKRASPGELLGTWEDGLYHDCTTLPGSSGSPLFDARTGGVVGVHLGGRFAFRNTAARTRVLQDWMSNAVRAGRTGPRGGP